MAGDEWYAINKEVQHEIVPASSLKLDSVRFLDGLGMLTWFASSALWVSIRSAT